MPDVMPMEPSTNGSRQFLQVWGWGLSVWLILEKQIGTALQLK